LGQNGGGSLSFEVVIAGERQTYPTMAQALDVATMSANRSGAPAAVVSPPGSDNVMVQVGPDGRSRMLFAERQDEYDRMAQALDETAQEIGAQVQQAAETAAPHIERAAEAVAEEAQASARDIHAQAQATPIPVLALGAGALLGGFLTKGKLLGFLGGAVAGYFLDKAVRR